MGITLLHGWLCWLLFGAFTRSICYWMLDNNPDSRAGKFLAYAG
jgi:hypothetical protein